MKKVFGLIAVLVLMSSSPAMAHFQMLYSPESALDKGREINLKLVFTHPYEAGHTMDMDQPESFVVLHKGKKEDLKKTLKPLTWRSLTNSGKAYEASYKMRGMGDWVFGVIPAPYYEGSEDAYIQQMTKAVYNVAGAPTDWNSMLDFPAEIRPLVKPYAVWAGSTFSGVVLSKGRPVPYAEIEVEYLNHEPDMSADCFAEQAKSVAPQDAFVTLGMQADAHGVFTFGIPKAGWWGFAALGVGPRTEFKGKDLSQDAVIWVQAQEMGTE